METTAIREVVVLHAKWRSGHPAGRKADLRGADLREAELSWVDLSDADLRGAHMDKATVTP